MIRVRISANTWDEVAGVIACLCELFTFGPIKKSGKTDHPKWYVDCEPMTAKQLAERREGW